MKSAYDITNKVTANLCHDIVDNIGLVMKYTEGEFYTARENDFILCNMYMQLYTNKPCSPDDESQSRILFVFSKYRYIQFYIYCNHAVQTNWSEISFGYFTYIDNTVLSAGYQLVTNWFRG